MTYAKKLMTKSSLVLPVRYGAIAEN